MTAFSRQLSSPPCRYLRQARAWSSSAQRLCSTMACRAKARVSADWLFCSAISAASILTASAAVTRVTNPLGSISPSSSGIALTATGLVQF
ncbi:hypothetical protein D3C78_1735120 [compost metagenome]